MSISSLKSEFLAILGVVGIFLGKLFGGWDTAMQVLITLMVVDYLTGWIVAGVFHKSPKTDSGRLSSNYGWQGLAKKGVTLSIVMVATQLDILTGNNFIRLGVIFPFIANEVVSLVENAGLMGVPIPSILTDAIDLLQKKGDE